MRVYSEGGQMPGGLYDHPTIRNGDVRERLHARRREGARGLVGLGALNSG